MKRILITGADSFIGTSFERYVIEKFPQNYYIDTLDMKDPSWRNKDFFSYDVVFHVAGIAHSDSGKVNSDIVNMYYSVNRDLAIETANKAKSQGVKQFIFMSSAIVYGESSKIGQPKMITADTPLTPANYYGDSKLQAEFGLEKIRDKDFKIAVLRPPIIYGRGCKGNYASLVRFAKSMPLFPYIKNTRSMLYIDNLCELIRLLIDNNEDGTFFPQNTEYCNTSEVVKLIAEVYGKKLVLVKGFSWALKFLSLFTSVVNKGFGSLAYDMSLSEYKQPYRVVSDFKETLKLTENIS